MVWLHPIESKNVCKIIQLKWIAMNVAIFSNDIFHATFVVLVKTRRKKTEKNTYSWSTSTQSLQCLWIAVHTMNQNKSQLSSYCMFTFWAIGLSYSLQQFTILQVNCCAFNTMIFQGNLLLTDCTTNVYGLNEKRMMINQVERNGIYSQLRPMYWRGKKRNGFNCSRRKNHVSHKNLFMIDCNSQQKKNFRGFSSLASFSLSLWSICKSMRAKLLFIPFFSIYFESNNCLAEINFDVRRFVWSV